MKSIRRFLTLMFILVLNVTATTLDVTPDPGETDVLQNVVVKAIFPEPLDPASVTQESVKLMHDDPLTLWELLELLLGYGNEDALYVVGYRAFDVKRVRSVSPRGHRCVPGNTVRPFPICSVQATEDGRFSFPHSGTSPSARTPLRL